MRIFAITDIHGRQNFNETIAKKMSDVDLVLIAGDITHFGGEKEANTILQTIKNVNKNIFAVSGNCDHEGVNTALTSQHFNLHGECRKVKEIVFCGLNGSNKTPLHTPQEYKDSEMEALLRNFDKTANARCHVLLSHAPPAKTKIDKIFLGFHVGSKAIRNFIEKFQPDLVICGHIHEARGIDTIGKTLVINPGPFPKHYALINCGERIDYELY
jgi:hypothetical protein